MAADRIQHIVDFLVSNPNIIRSALEVAETSIRGGNSSDGTDENSVFGKVLAELKSVKAGGGSRKRRVRRKIYTRRK